MTVVVSLITCVAIPVYGLGVVVVIHHAVRTLPDWLRKHPAALGGPALRILSATVIALLWPCCLLARGVMSSREPRRSDASRCTRDDCESGRASRARINALVMFDRCEHERARVSSGVPLERAAQAEEERPDVSWPVAYGSLCAGLSATTLGAFASLPIQGPGFLAVYLAVTLTTVFPLELLAEVLLTRIAAVPRAGDLAGEPPPRSRRSSYMQNVTRPCERSLLTQGRRRTATACGHCVRGSARLPHHRCLRYR